MGDLAEIFQIVLESVQHRHQRNGDELRLAVNRLLVFLEINLAVFRCADRDDIHATFAKFGIGRERTHEMQFISHDPATDAGYTERL